MSGVKTNTPENQDSWQTETTARMAIGNELLAYQAQEAMFMPDRSRLANPHEAAFLAKYNADIANRFREMFMTTADGLFKSKAMLHYQWALDAAPSNMMIAAVHSDRAHLHHYRIFHGDEALEELGHDLHLADANLALVKGKRYRQAKRTLAEEVRALALTHGIGADTPPLEASMELREKRLWELAQNAGIAATQETTEINPHIPIPADNWRSTKRYNGWATPETHGFPEAVPAFVD